MIDGDFIKAHLGIDMTALEIARYFGCDPARVHEYAERHQLLHRFDRPTQLCTPYRPVIGTYVRKATAADIVRPEVAHMKMIPHYGQIR